MDFNKKVITFILLQEEDEEEELLFCTRQKIQRRAIDQMFKSKMIEGAETNLLEHLLETMPTPSVHKPISSWCKLALTIRLLAIGESLRSLAFQFRISHSWISICVREVINAMIYKLMPLYLPTPTEAILKDSARTYYERWGFPNCIGSIDGKHVRIVCPKNSGLLYFNYKKFFSIVLLAIVDAEYKFLAVDVGSYRKEGDSSIFAKSKMGKLIRTDRFNIPRDQALPNSNEVLPYVIFGDEAFRLQKHIMRPYPKNQAEVDASKELFNKRLCRARRTAENAFGILCQTFRILYTPINLMPKTVDKVILVCCSLHNMLRSSTAQDTRERLTIGENSNATPNLIQMSPSVGNHATHEAFVIRDHFKDYFVNNENDRM